MAINFKALDALRRGRSEENWEHACYEGNHDAEKARELGFKWFPGVTAPQ